MTHSGLQKFYSQHFIAATTRVYLNMTMKESPEELILLALRSFLKKIIVSFKKMYWIVLWTHLSVKYISTVWEYHFPPSPSHTPISRRQNGSQFKLNFEYICLTEGCNGERCELNCRHMGAVAVGTGKQRLSQHLGLLLLVMSGQILGLWSLQRRTNKEKWTSWTLLIGLKPACVLLLLLSSNRLDITNVKSSRTGLH